MAGPGAGWGTIYIGAWSTDLDNALASVELPVTGHLVRVARHSSSQCPVIYFIIWCFMSVMVMLTCVVRGFQCPEESRCTEEIVQESQQVNSKLDNCPAL